MKRIMILLMTVFFLAACGSAYNDLLKEANEAMEEQDYKNAKKLYELAIAEDAAGTEANEMLRLLEDYEELMELQEDSEWEKAFDQANSLLKNSAITSALKDDVKDVLTDVEEMKDEEEELLAEIKAITKLLQQNNVDDAYAKIDLLDEDFASVKVAEAWEKMDDALQDTEKRVSEKEALELAAAEDAAKKEEEIKRKEAEAAKRREAEVVASQSQYSKYIQKANNLEAETSYGNGGAYYTQWDNLLNEVWDSLRNTMDSSDFESLKKHQNDWIKEKDGRYNDAKNIGNESKGKDRLTFDTKERTYYLIENYMY